MKMENIRIEVKGNDYIVVTADTERFGKDEVMFEGNTFRQCFDYIKRELGMDAGAKLNLSSFFIYQPYTDRMGETFPWLMNVNH